MVQISSGLLEWSPVHRSDKFWRENAVKLNDDRHKLVKILIQLLETSSDPQASSTAPFPSLGAPTCAVAALHRFPAWAR